MQSEPQTKMQHQNTMHVLLIFVDFLCECELTVHIFCFLFALFEHFPQVFLEPWFFMVRLRHGLAHFSGCIFFLHFLNFQKIFQLKNCNTKNWCRIFLGRFPPKKVSVLCLCLCLCHPPANPWVTVPSIGEAAKNPLFDS